MPDQKLTTPGVVLFASAAEEIAIIVRTEHEREFQTMMDLEDYFIDQGKAVADTISRILPSPVVSVIIARLMDLAFRPAPINNKQTERGGNHDE